MYKRFSMHVIVYLLCVCACRGPQPEIMLDELTIDDIHEAVRSGRLTFVALTQTYIARIQQHDQSSGLNAVVTLNPHAVEEAAAMDAEFQRSGELRPLQGIPILVKDNYQTQDMQTTAGSQALQGFVPSTDAFQIRRLRAAGAVILGKTNMAEWAFSPYVTESSLAGVTRNPYDLNRVPAGSSGGTAAAVAANFATVGLGTDTGNSIRGPSAHTALVGIRSSMGLTSRSGIVPLLIHHDIGGPMARTVEDAVRVLDVIAAYDEEDPVTAVCHHERKRPASYQAFLRKDGLQGVRIGVFREYFDTPESDEGIKQLSEQALRSLQAAGAVLVDPFRIDHFAALSEDLWCEHFAFQYDLDRYLAGLGQDAPYHSLREIVATGKYATYIEESLQEALQDTVPITGPPPCPDVFKGAHDNAFRGAIINAMQRQAVDIIVYPTWSNVARKIGDLDSPAGDNSQYFAPHTGFPAITVPSGFTQEGLPAGLSFVAPLCEEGRLLAAAYAYEQATHHRRPPAGVPLQGAIGRR